MIIDREDHEETQAKASDPELFPLTAECHHYVRRKDVEWDVQKYWDQRYRLFSRYDEGVYMTNESWFGVTPELLALRVAHDFSNLLSPSKTDIIDLFAGVGGNTIAFALSGRWARVIAIEKDPAVLACAQRNALIYGVFDKIIWINSDCFSYLSTQESAVNASTTVIFASPPWGGPGYSGDKIFDLSKMEPYSVLKITSATAAMDTALFLPRTSDLNQIASLAPPGKKIEVVQYCMDGASKGLVAYVPAV